MCFRSSKKNGSDVAIPHVVASLTENKQQTQLRYLQCAAKITQIGDYAQITTKKENSPIPIFAARSH